MIIERNCSQYQISSQASIKEALKKIVRTRGRILFVTDAHNIVLGALSNGDILRWLTEQKEPDLSSSVSKVMNTQFRSLPESARFEDIQSELKKVLFVPLLDQAGHLVSIARRRKEAESLNFGTRRISELDPVFIIAEIGNNHNGSLEAAYRLIDAAAEAGVDCVKFQMRTLQKLYVSGEDASKPNENLGTQYTLDLLQRFQLKDEELFKALEYAESLGLCPLCTPWDSESLKKLEDFGLKGYKVASADLTNHMLLKELSQTGKPLICSTGMSRESEIISAVRVLQENGAIYALLHCNSAYPPPIEDINLRYLQRLREIGKSVVGYSGHEKGIEISLAAVALGAKIIEKHITLDRSLEGTDHKISLLPEELKSLVKGIRKVEASLGSTTPREISQGEMINRVTLAKSLFATRDIQPGETIELSDIEIKSPGRGLQPDKLKELIGKTAQRQILQGECFYESDLKEQNVEPRSYHFSRPWGIPVRYHDFRRLLEKVQPDFLEFHLSYHDLDCDLKEFFDSSDAFNLGLVVHSPELFSGDHLLDLCSLDKSYRERSISEMNRVTEVTRKLREYFDTPQPTLIVTNVGGFSEDSFLSRKEVEQRYEIFLESLEKVDLTDVEIIPQTMPPFPWHFGGQRFHNLFVSAEDIRNFCDKYSFRVCLDVSHSKLACTQLKWSFDSFLKKVAPVSAHLHIADAKNSTGEGLQLGEGDINFRKLFQVLDKLCPTASMIPEIWQGHERDGEGFWIALDYLEKCSQTQ